MEIIVFGGGCFWCTEAAFEMFKGVVKTTAGYAGGTTKNPTYQQVCTGKTGHAEVLRIEYDPGLISLDTLFDIFFSMHDPTSLNGQGTDIGAQYRSIILYSSEEQREAAERFIAKLQDGFKKPIVTELKRLDVFYPAEDHHQRYYDKNPHQPYCLIVIGPKIAKIRKKYGLGK